MKVWMRRRLTALRQRAQVAARNLWRELPNNVMAAVIAQGMVSGDPMWIAMTSFMLVMLAILRR